MRDCWFDEGILGLDEGAFGPTKTFSRTIKALSSVDDAVARFDHGATWLDKGTFDRD